MDKAIYFKAKRNRFALIAYLLMAIILIFQFVAYYQFRTLSLGPRVVLQPWLMRQGYRLYDDIADEHAPLLSLLLAALQPVSSDSLQVAKITLTGFVTLIAISIFLISKSDKGNFSGILALLFFVCWSPAFGYSKLWHETILALIYMLLFALWQPQFEGAKPEFYYVALTGFLSGIAILVKQHAAIFVIALFIFSIISWAYKKKNKLTVLLWAAIEFVFALLPLVGFLLYHRLQGGTLEGVFFWTIQFSFVNQYSKLAAQHITPTQISQIVPAYLLLIPFALMTWQAKKENNSIWLRNTLSLILLIASSLTAWPRFGFFHLQASLPILAWISGTTLVQLKPIRPTEITQSLAWRGMIGSFLCLWMMYAGMAYYNDLKNSSTRKISEYSSLLTLAVQIRRIIPADECIYLLPDDEGTANLYYLVQCTPPKFWVPTSYPWFSLERIKSQAIQAVKIAQPEWIVYLPGRWNIEQHDAELIEQILKKDYRFEIEIPWIEQTVQLWKRM